MHVYYTTIQAIKRSEWLLTVEKKAFLQVWKLFYHHVCGTCRYILLFCYGGRRWINSKKKTFCLEKRSVITDYSHDFTVSLMDMELIARISISRICLFEMAEKLSLSHSHSDTSLFVVKRNVLICGCVLHHPISAWGAHCRYRPQGYKTDVMKKWQWRRMCSCAMWFCNAILCNLVL